MNYIQDELTNILFAGGNCISCKQNIHPKHQMQQVLPDCTGTLRDTAQQYLQEAWDF